MSLNLWTNKPNRKCLAKLSLRKIVKDTAGLALIEFALILPIFITFGVVGLEFTNLVLTKQKTERLASTMADQVAGNQVQPNERQIKDLFSAVELVAAPYSIAPKGNVAVTAVVGIVDTDDDEVQNKIAWQRCLTSNANKSAIGEQWSGSNDIAQGPQVTLPNNIELAQNQMVIVAEVFYPYEPIVADAIIAKYVQPGEIFRETTVFRTRGAPIMNVTPVTGVAEHTC